MRQLWTSLAFVVLFARAVAAQSSIDKTPDWYRGSKPWTSITKEGREELLRMRAGYEAIRDKAEKPGPGVSGRTPADGRKLIDKIITKSHVDAFYLKPSMFGPRTVIWLPEQAWDGLSVVEKKSIEAYMSGSYAN